MEYQATRPYKYPVIRINPVTGEMVRFESIAEAARATGISSKGQLALAIAKGWKCHGYEWDRAVI